MIPKECRSCKWREGLAGAEHCYHEKSKVEVMIISIPMLASLTFNYARSERGPCGPEAKLYEKDDS